MSASGKAQNANTLRVDSPLFSVIPRNSNGSLRILQRLLVARRLFRLRYPIFHQGRCDSDTVQPVANFRPFQVIGQYAITATWEDQHGGAGVLVFRSWIERHTWRGDVAQAD